MKIKKLRVKNYKSILDSGDVYFEEGITILAGMNESGKTSLLEALEDFDTDRSPTSSCKLSFFRFAGRAGCYLRSGALHASGGRRS